MILQEEESSAEQDGTIFAIRECDLDKINELICSHEFPIQDHILYKSSGGIV